MIYITFIVSFFILSFLIILKAFQIRFGDIMFIKNLNEKGDVFLNNLIYSVLVRVNYFKKVVYIFVFDFLPSLLYEFLVKSKDYVARRYYSSANEFRGRRMLRSDGSVSTFLERLSEDK